MIKNEKISRKLRRREQERNVPTKAQKKKQTKNKNDFLAKTTGNEIYALYTRTLVFYN